MHRTNNRWTKSVTVGTKKVSKKSGQAENMEEMQQEDLLEKEGVQQHQAERNGQCWERTFSYSAMVTVDDDFKENKTVFYALQSALLLTAKTLTQMINCNKLKEILQTAWQRLLKNKRK